MGCNSPGSSVHGDPPGKKTGVPCRPPGDPPTPGIEPGLLHCRQLLYCLSQQGRPRSLFCRGFSDPGMELGSQASQADSSSSYRSH
ncbi:unnamed protein product [Rangifer tarandus platyrhynchus]|uniref:Uncharacterized protein n=1 Tax=Rangifer tarandus platyrhynchus TaxID=3082113 RepID=A0AC59Z3S1_RANTA